MNMDPNFIPNHTLIMLSCQLGFQSQQEGGNSTPSQGCWSGRPTTIQGSD